MDRAWLLRYQGAAAEAPDLAHQVTVRAFAAVNPHSPLSMAFYTYWADVPVTGGELYGRDARWAPGRPTTGW